MFRRVQPIATIVVLFLACSSFVLAAERTSTVPDPKNLQAEFDRIGKSTRDVLGVTAYHIESRERVSVRGTEPFPMASVYKVPIALQFLHLVELRKASLDEPITIFASDLQYSHSVLPRRMQNGMVTLTTRELLRLMLVDSDNTSSDIILRLAGGPAAVTQRMRGLGISGIRVDRSIVDMTLDENGVTYRPPEELWTRQTIRLLIDTVSPTARRAAFYRFINDPRDTATPDAMVHLLYILHQRTGLLQPNADWLVQLMEQSETGALRLRGLIPKATPVAHKTGTLDCCISDVGIITLPNGKGHVLIAAFFKGFGDSGAARQTVIAQLARAAYEHWTGEKLPRVTPKKPAKRIGGTRTSRRAALTRNPSRRTPVARKPVAGAPKPGNAK